ncbi:MAG TPA: glycosyltransferase [Pseudobdellovibrionaceae bacterium]|nr:glycosyltransferase [Pseudobdellovibrionaceae bacterium]
MKRLVKLDEGVHERLFPSLDPEGPPLYLASSEAGIEAYRRQSGARPGELHLWIESEEALRRLAARGRELRARFVFPFGRLRPSEIAAHGSFDGPEEFEIRDEFLTDLSLLDPGIELLQKASTPSPSFSVVMPFFEDEERTAKALASWRRALPGRAELILIDDGSAAGSWVRALVGTDPAHLTLLRLERKRKRRRGDSAFRAGIARNIGVRHSRADKIVFCDSDLLVPADFFSLLEPAFASADLIMPRRWQLSEKASRELQNADEVLFDRDTLLGPGAYWETFQTEDRPWALQETPWRWTSTFCLAMSRELFERTGGFKKTFLTYGFEDTELGYRLHRAGARFHLLPVPLYHLHQPESRSEYGNDPRKKTRLLRRSADRFFRHHPHRELYEALKDWLD